MQAIGVWVASFSTGAAIGPLLGGLLLSHYWWGSVFLINVPLMLLLLALGSFLLPEFRDPKAGRLDLISAAESLIAVLFIIYGTKRAAETGNLLTGAPFAIIGLVIGWIFIRRQFSLAHPLVELHLFRSLTFSTALLAGVLAFFVNFGAIFFTAQYLQLVLGFDPLKAGFWTMPYALGFVAGSIASPRIARRVGPAVLVSAGFSLAALGLAVIALFGSQAHGLAALVVGGVILSLGLAPVIILSTDLVVGAAPPERAGSASALSETSAELGGALGIAILGSVITAVYRGKVAGLTSIGISPEIVAGIKDSLAAAVAIVEGLPPHFARPILESAREAFVQGVQLSAGLGAAVAVTAAVIAVTVLHSRTARDRKDPSAA